MTFHSSLQLIASYAMSQQKLMTSSFQQSSKMASLQQVHGNAESARQLMDDKEKLLIFLVLFLFIGGVAMGYMAHG